ncbi:chemosensory pili system protein ChpA (sensor histidine kinase/response regulator) [Oxalobacteraceae bacterium GrIS 1.18]
MISSDSTQSMQNKFDTGPLSWVMAETREALMSAKRALHDALEQSAESQSTLLKHARTYLHQAHGALQMVDVEGVAKLSEIIEVLLDRMTDGQLAIELKNVNPIEQALDAIQEYLDELLVSGLQQPVRLFPYYRNLLLIKGTERINPVDLFSPNLIAASAITLVDDAANTIQPRTQKISYANIRKRFELALLPFLKQSDEQLLHASVKQMQNLLAEIWAAQTNSQSRSFWAVMHGFAELTADQQLFKEQHVKQLFGRINLQIRRLVEGALSIPESLMRDALFFIARTENLSPNAAIVHQAYQLEGQVPASFEVQQYGGIESGALAICKERLGQIKSLWGKIANGDSASFEKFELKMKELADLAVKLKSAPLTKLMREMTGLSRHVMQKKPGEVFALEMATSLLFIESALDQIAHLPADFAERAEIVAARLLALISGESLNKSAPWLDEMSQKVQQRQTMEALVGEMQSSLRIVEKTLDEYFRDPADNSNLVQIDPIMHQIAGALAILDQEEANLALTHTQELIREMAQSTEPVDPSVHTKIAQNIGAMSFLIEALQTQPETAKNKFSFDRQTGYFKSHFLDVSAPAQHPELEIESVQATEEPALVHVSTEQELAEQHKQSANLASSLLVEPHNTQIQAQLIASLEHERSVARLLDDPNASERASQAIDILAQSDFDISDPQMNKIISAVGAEPEVLTVPSLPSHPPMPVGDDAVDAELLEVFLMEAEEVLDSVKETLPISRNDPGNPDNLITLRRSFHTLKGSGRMVGLGLFGNAAWSIEQVMNGWLADARPGTEDLYALLEKSSEVLGAWVNDLNSTGTSESNGLALISAAEHFKNYGTFSYQEIDQEAGELNAPMHVARQAVATELNDSQLPAVTDEKLSSPISQANPKHERVETLTVPEISFDFRPLDRSAPTDLSSPGSTAFGNETKEIDHSRLGEQVDADDMADLGVPEQGYLLSEINFGAESSDSAPSDGNPHNNEIERPEQSLVDPVTASDGDASDEINEESSDDKLNPVQEAKIIEFPTNPSFYPEFEDNVKKIGNIEIGVPLYNIYLAETDEIVRFLTQDFSEWRHEPHRLVTRHAVHAAHSLAGSSATVGFAALQEVAHALEMVLQRLERHPVTLLPGEFDTLDRCMACVKEMLHQFALTEMPSNKPEQILVLEQLLAILTDRAQPPEFDLPADLSHQSDGVESNRDLTNTHGYGESAFAESLDGEEIEHEAVDVSLVGSPLNYDVEPTVIPIAQEKIEDAKLFDASALPKDDLDADLLPIFLEEGSDLFPLIGQTLRAWQSAPQDTEISQSLLRLLHTVKGSARMAGAMALGQHTHDMESQIENFMQAGAIPSIAIESLLTRHDAAMLMFDQLRNPSSAAVMPISQDNSEPARSPENELTGTKHGHLVEVPKFVNLGLIKTTPPTAAPVLNAGAAANTPLVRVRADILDRLVNQAGEVSISRSRLENEVSTLRSSLSELNENVGRLRDQLREVEIQAETQISSRMAMSGEREFDPLEFDRFTRLQELTRMMAESVSDVSTLQVNISKTVEGATDDLRSQARLTRELQQDLMRVRMVPFASISERLYRITRQASKELDKRVNLDIRGTSVEIDRSVLEKMAGPFEHLLRNAIVHGIETREKRLALGKSEIGEIQVQIRQEGNEVVINFNDDGQGLDLQRIREKAQQTGLLAVDEEVTDTEASNLIFESGFSTAHEITELAGRGVGMDVVRSEASSLGGRVSVSSIPNVGSNFTINLPLTLAVTQVVLLSCGAKTYAVPSVLVEQVQQLKAQALAAAYNEGAIMWQGQRVPMHYLSTVLADYDALPVSQQYTPIIIMRSGNDRVALHVDQVVGNREVVVKNIGQQLSRMAGISGATVLGSGDIVLILNPLPLAQKMEHEMLRAPRILQQNSEHPEVSGADDQLGAVLETRRASSQPVQGLRRHNIVMVVDDSLTVRKVTQRLLLREGYQVVLAKDGVDALQQLQAITPDVMLVDIEMPRMDGFDLTRNIRNDERLCHIPIIMITSRTADKHRNYAQELGVNAYFGKPYQEDVLLNAILGFLPNISTVQ